MYNDEQLTELINHWNANAFKTVSLYSARASIEKRLAPAYNKGYTVEQLKNVIDKVRENNGGGYIEDNIYKVLAVRNIKSVLNGTAPSAEPTEPTEPTTTAEPSAEPTTEPTANEPTTEPTAAPSAFENAMLSMFAPYIDTVVKKQVETAAANGAIETPLTIITPAAKVTTADKHEKFEQVLSAVANGESLYLHGPAGSGKNVICKQVADALGLDFYYTNSVTQEYKLTGYMDAYGKFHETELYKAMKNGGLFMLDELDASIPETLILLNGMLSDGFMIFANGEKVIQHKDFHVIAAGNTFGKGASTEYGARYRLDGSTLDRFVPKEINYSRKIENALADSETVTFCRAFRDACKKCGVPHIISYRAIIKLAKLETLWGIKDALNSAIISDLTADDVNMIKEYLPCGNRFTDALA